jgi:ribosomal protein L19E
MGSRTGTMRHQPRMDRSGPWYSHVLAVRDALQQARRELYRYLLEAVEA